MQPSEAGTARQPAVARQEELSASARGWHTIQMAVLGFIGICGVLRTTGSSPAPRAVEWLAAALAVAALVAACLAVFTVGRVAYPVSTATGDAGVSPDAAGAARLRAGIRLTIVALILAVLAGLSGWWPSAAAATATAITGTTGQAWCGQLVDGPTGAISVRTANGVIAVPAQAIAQVRPVAACP